MHKDTLNWNPFKSCATESEANSDTLPSFLKLKKNNNEIYVK